MQLARIGRWTAAAALAAAACLGSTGASAQPAIEAAALRALYEKLITPTVDAERHLDVGGRTLTYEDLAVTFADGGVVHPVVRSDGKVVGVAYAGRGELRFTPPGASEQQQLDRFFNAPQYVHEFTNAWIMTTDDTVDRLLGEGGEWASGDGGAAAKVEMVHHNRHELYRDRKWDDYGPSLEMDVLQDLYGDGYRGGYVYAEFGTDPIRWTTYYRNPRGALYRGEEVCLFSHWPRGAAPQNMEVYSSYPSADPAIPRGPGIRDYDLSHVDAEVTIPGVAGGQDLARVEFDVTERITGIGDGVGAIELRLQSRRARCKGDEPYGTFKIVELHDFTDHPVPAIHDRNRLFVVLRTPLNRGEIEELTIRYAGDLIEPVTVDEQANVFYTAFQEFAWYPRALWPDRHSLRTTIHAPRFMRGVGTGNLEGEGCVDEDKQRTCVYEEKGGVLGGMLAVGEYVEPTEETVDGVRVMVFTSQRDKQEARDLLAATKAMLTYFSALWGPYPYSTLTMIDLHPLPAGNWNFDATESVTATQEAGWTCSPPGQLYAWQGFAASDTGAMSYLFPPTAPPVDELQSRGLNYYFTDSPEASMAYTASMVARQWWGQFVGPASYRSRWITEGAAMLSAGLYLNQFQGRKAMDRRVDAWHDMALRRGKLGSLLTGDRLGQDTPDVLWGKGPAVLQMLMDQIGGDPFVNLMRSTINRCPTTGLTNDTFLAVAREYVGADEMDAFWDYWVEGTAVPGLRSSTEIVEGEERGTFVVRGTLLFEDAPPPPGRIPIEIRFGKKEADYRWIEPDGERTEFTFEGFDKKPKNVTVDPGKLVLLKYRKPLKE